MKILVLGGGDSPEREVSFRSAKNVEEALTKAGFEVFFFDPSAGIKPMLKIAKKVDAVFPILHGQGGEDGKIQSILEDQGIKYLGSRPKALKDTFDKFVFKIKCLKNGVLVPRGERINLQSFHRSNLIKKPFVLKPLKSGSAIDTCIIRGVPVGFELIDKTIRKYDSMLLEELIEGWEITVGILDQKPLSVIEIIPPPGEEFDFENRYNGLSQELCPPLNVSQDIQKKAQQLALKVHQTFSCRHFSRVDMIVRRNEIFVLEINTIPGMTKASLFPKAALTDGLTLEYLVKRLVNLALKAG